MNNGKKIAIIIATIFVIAVVVSAAILFSVKKISVEYDVYGDRADTVEISKSMDTFKGKNYLFFNTDKVKEKLKDYPYYEILSVEKQFPNVINVKLKKRIETFSVKFGAATYVLNEDGILLNSDGSTSGENKVIDVTTEGIEVKTAVLGAKLETSDDALFLSALSMAKIANLSDFIKSVEIISETEKKDVIFYTFTGVKITIIHADERGAEKIEKTLSAFEEASDYVKSYSEIIVFVNNQGETVVQWINEK